MTEILVQIIFGWSAIITSILLSIAGVMLKRPGPLVTAGIICIPFTYYISNGFSTPAFLLPFFAFGSAYAITRQKNRVAWLLIAPIFIVAVVLAYTVLTQ